MSLIKVKPRGTVNASGRRNMVINGGMQVAQRLTTSRAATSDGYGAVDRWKLNNQSTAVIEMSQSTTVPTGQGFSNSIKLNVTTADTSLTSGVQALFRQRFEGQNLQHLKKGTSGAESTTLSFWVRSPKTGTHIVELFDTDNSRHINKAYTISSANTWEHKSIPIEGDTTGAFTNDKNLSLEMTWHLCAGSNFQSGTLQTSWGSNTSANRAVGQVNVFDSTSNEFYLTGVQWEIGDESNFEHRSFGEELPLCQRYFESRGTASGNWEFIFDAGMWYSTTGYQGAVRFREQMRVAPSMSYTGTITNYKLVRDAATFAVSSAVAADNTNGRSMLIYGNVANPGGSAPDGEQCRMQINTTDHFFYFDADL